MNLEKFVVIGGLPGVHKIVNSRAGGLIIEDKHENRTRFVPVRQHQFTPLNTVGVYVDTDEGTLPLGEVWQRMHDQLDATPIPPQSASSAEFREYFTKVLPEHDQFRVHINDIKKCLKWFGFMQEKGLFAEAIAADNKEEPAGDEAVAADNKEEPAGDEAVAADKKEEPAAAEATETTE